MVGQKSGEKWVKEQWTGRTRQRKDKRRRKESDMESRKGYAQ